MRLPWKSYYHEPHNSCCALVIHLLCGKFYIQKCSALSFNMPDLYP